jgi:hypothetical protein
VFFEVYNEADYKATGQAQGPWQLYTIWTNPTDGGAMQEISNDIRAVTSTHWIIQDGISAAKAQWFPPNISTGYLGITPTTDTQTVYSFHKYDPAAFVDEGDGNPSNPLLIYPVPSHNDFAIGRPGNTALAFLPPVPVFGTPAWQTTVDASGSCAGAAWVQSPTPLTGSGQQKACVKPGGGANATLTDFYTPATNSTDFGNANVNREYTKAELLNNISTGINLVVGWAAAGGHGSGPLAAVPMKIMAGEIGQTSYIIDYLSRLQFTTDIMNVLETTGVPGGQSSIPWDQWAFSGAKLGIKPKGGGDPGYTGAGLTHNNFCLNANPADPLFGYDIDYWARIKTVSGVHPTPNPNPACDTSTGPNYGTPGL